MELKAQPIAKSGWRVWARSRRCPDWLGPAIIAIVIVFTQAEWLNRNFPGYPPLRFDSAVYFARCLDNVRALELAGWPAIGAFFREPDVPGAAALIVSGVLAVLLIGNSYPLILTATNSFWMALLGIGVQWQARNLGWKGRWPWPAALILGWPSVIGMAREFRTELPLMACTSLLAAALLSQRLWKDSLYTAGISALLVLSVMAKPVSACLLIPLIADFLLGTRRQACPDRGRRLHWLWFLSGVALIAFLLAPSVRSLLQYYGAYGRNYETYGQKLVSDRLFSQGALGRLLYYPANLLTTHLSELFLFLQFVVLFYCVLKLRWENGALRSVFARPLRLAALYWGFGMCVLALYGVRSPAGDFSFVSFLIPLMLSPWISLASMFRAGVTERMLVAISVGLTATSLAAAIQTPAAAWAGLSADRVEPVDSWGLQKVAKTIQAEPDIKDPVDVLVLANHTVVNYQTVRVELLKTLGLERAISSVAKVWFYTPPAKDLSHPAVRAATHLLVKSSQGGPPVSWISDKAAQFFTLVKNEPSLGVEPLWEAPLRLADNSELMLYRKRLQ